MTLRTFLPRLFLSRNIALTIALILILLSALLKHVKLEKKAPIYQATFDISQSMYVEDVGVGTELNTRLQKSKDAALYLLQTLPCGSRLGWSVFVGSRVLGLVTPLEVCAHYDGLVSSLNSINGNMRWTNSSSIGKGLHQSMRSASEIDSGTAVLFFSDGHESPPLRTGDRGMPAKGNLEVNGIVVGVGGLKPVRMPKYDAQNRFIGYWGPGEVVQRKDVPDGSSHEELSEVHEAHLNDLARLAEFSYVHLTSPSALTRAIKTASHGTQQAVPTDLRWIPASLALLLLCWNFLPIFRRRG